MSFERGGLAELAHNTVEINNNTVLCGSHEDRVNVCKALGSCWVHRESSVSVHRILRVDLALPQALGWGRGHSEGCAPVQLPAWRGSPAVSNYLSSNTSHTGNVKRGVIVTERK